MLNDNRQELNNNQNIVYLKTLEPVQKALDNIKEKAHQDGLNQIECNYQGIKSALRMVLHRITQLVNAELAFLKDKMPRIKQKITKTIKDQESLQITINEQHKTVKLLSGIIYTIAGMLFVFGDIEFSRQTIITAWNMQNDSLFGQVSLILGLAFITVYIKLVYERIIEPRYKPTKITQDVLFSGVYVITALACIGIFVYLGYVRAIYHEYSLRTDIIGDIYDVIFNDHPFMDSIAFGGIAFIFLIGGAVTLTVGFKELRHYWDYRINLRKEKKLADQLIKLEKRYDVVSKNYYETKEKQAFFRDGKNFEQYLEDQTAFYIDVYKSNYAKGKKEGLRNKAEIEKKNLDDLSKENFHDLVRVMLDKRMINNSNMQEAINHA